MKLGKLKKALILAMGISMAGTFYVPQQTLMASVVTANVVRPASWADVAGSIANGVTLDLSNLPAAANQTITIPSSVNTIAIVGDSSKTYTGLSIKVDNRASALNMGIKTLNINASECGIDLGSGTVATNLEFEGENKIKTAHGSGIFVHSGATLNLKANQSSDVLDILANGTRDSHTGAGIGGFYRTNGDMKCGFGDINIDLNQGQLTVQGGDGAAGIGGSGQEKTGESTGNITIKSGTIKATGGYGSAGIGGGWKEQMNLPLKTITIEGGTITAIAGEGGAGIGGGCEGNGSEMLNYDIVINGQTIIESAQGKGGGAGIGSGAKSSAHYITISGKATIKEAIGSDLSGHGGAGIGGGCERGFEKLIIGTDGETTESGPSINNAKGGTGAAGIGSGGFGTTGSAGEIYLYSGVIDLVTANNAASAIGGGFQRGVDKIYVGNTLIKRAETTGGGAGIGSGSQGQNGSGTIEINKPLFTSASGYSALGGGHERESNLWDKITLNTEVFTDGPIKKSSTEYVTEIGSGANRKKLYGFECYWTDAAGNPTTKITSGVDFSIKNRNDATVDIKPDNYVDGTIYAYLKDIGTHESTSENYQTLGAGTNYYMLIETQDPTTGERKLHFAEEFERVADSHGFTTIKMKFVEKPLPNPALVLNPADGNKIIPYSLSNIEFESDIQKDTDTNVQGDLDQILSVKAQIDLKKMASDVAPFDLSNANKVKLVVYEKNASGKFVKNNTLSNELNAAAVLDNGNKTIKVTFPSAMNTFKKYKIRIYLPNTLTKKFNQYLANYVKAAAPNNAKEINVKLTYTIQSYVIIDGVKTAANPHDKSVSQNIDVKYCDVDVIH